MLQWMGGSRRKVNTSRRSTQKRQKQYFEQRKWQEQQKKDASERFFEEKSACNQHANSSHSLDILSLLNLSTRSGNKSNVHSARHSYEENAVNPDNQTLQRLPVIKTKDAICLDPIQHKEGTSPRPQDYAACQKKESVGATGGHEKTLYGTDDKVNPLMTSTVNQLSIIDILGDDGPNSELERSTHEGHVAFSIEGLGKVETVTPVHSPQVPGRPFSDGRSSPPRARRKALSSDYLNRRLDGFERELDNMMADVDLPFCTSPLYESSSSRGITDLLGSSEQKVLDSKWFSSHDNNLTDLYTFKNEETFSKSNESSNTIWNGNSNYPLHESFHEDCGSPHRHCVYHFDAGSADCWNKQSSMMREFNLEDSYYQGSANSFSARGYGTQATCSNNSYLQKQRVCMRARSEFNMIDSPTPSSTHFKPGNIRDFSVSDGEWCSMGRSNPHFLNHVDCAERTWFANEDARNNLSLLSEESCSSTAVVSDLDTQQKMNSSNKRRSQEVSDGSKLTKYCEKLFAKGRNCHRNDIRQGKEMDELTELLWLPNQSSTKPAHYHPAFCEKRSDLKTDGLGEAKCDPGESYSGFRAFNQTSGSKHVSGSDFWTRDVLGDQEPKLHVKSLRNLNGSMKYPGKYAPSCFELEPMTFEQDSPRCAYGDLFQDSKKGFSTEDSLHALGFLGKVSGNPIRSVGKSFLSNGDKGIDVLTFDSSQFDPKIEVSGACNGLSSGKEKSMDDASGSVNKCSNCEEPKEKTPDVEDRTRSFNYSRCAEETSSSIEISTILKGDQDCSDKIQDIQSSPRCQAGDEDRRSPSSEGRIIKQQSPSVHGNSQVMMLEAVSFNFYVCSF